MRSWIVGFSLLAFVAVPATAATPHKAAKKAHAVVKTGPATKMGAQPDMAQMLAVFDKMFPAQPDPDPARLALARVTAASMWPQNSYSDLMVGFMGPTMDRVLALKRSDLPMPATSKTSAADANVSIHDQVAAKDPYFDQRVIAIKAALTEEFGKISAVVDPRIRDGLARSMARRFDERQLTDINAFFATASGHALASQYMRMWMDPDMMRAFMSSIPEMIKLAPDIMEKAKAASDKYPSPSKDAAVHLKS